MKRDILRRCYRRTIKSDNLFDYFKFGDNIGDVVLTATSLDNPNVSFDVHVSVYKKEVSEPDNQDLQNRNEER